MTDDIPLTITVYDDSRLLISLSKEQLEEIAIQVAKILKEKANG